MTTTNLLILACGEGRRNAVFTFNNAMPKCLQTSGNCTILESIMLEYTDLVTDVYIACLEKHTEQIKAICEFKHITNYHVLPLKPTQSAYASLMSAITALHDMDKLVNANWYINWSDVYATMPSKQCKRPTIFVDTEYRHRNIAFVNSDDKVVVSSTKNMQGNVPGIFFVDGQLLNELRMSHGGQAIYDFDKLLALVPDCTLMTLQNVTDLGDYAKFSKYMTNYASEHTSRYFNAIQVEGKSVFKQPVTDYGMQLHRLELSYYKNIAYSIPAFATLLSYDRETSTMELERIKGCTCQSKLDCCMTAQQKQSKANQLLKAFTEAISQVHSAKPLEVPSTEDLNKAIMQEFVQAISDRVLPVKPLIDAAIAAGITSIDGMPIVSFDKLLDAVTSWVTDKIQSGYFSGGIVHGDPNTDNCLLQTNGKVRFIDPRGYFGKLRILGYGIKQYDYAKFVYGMTGYSRFNRAAFAACSLSEDGNLSTYLNIDEQEGISDVDLFKLDIDDDIRILVGIIWVKLSSYIINDPERSVLAYLYGNALLTKLLSIH